MPIEPRVFDDTIVAQKTSSTDTTVAQPVQESSLYETAYEYRFHIIVGALILVALLLIGYMVYKHFYATEPANTAQTSNKSQGAPPGPDTTPGPPLAPNPSPATTAPAAAEAPADKQPQPDAQASAQPSTQASVPGQPSAAGSAPSAEPTAQAPPKAQLMSILDRVRQNKEVPQSTIADAMRRQEPVNSAQQPGDTDVDTGTSPSGCTSGSTGGNTSGCTSFGTSGSLDDGQDIDDTDISYTGAPHAGDGLQTDSGIDAMDQNNYVSDAQIQDACNAILNGEAARGSLQAPADEATSRCNYKFANGRQCKQYGPNGWCQKHPPKA